jgi:cation diffusion facilitator family transporter
MPAQLPDLVAESEKRLVATSSVLGALLLTTMKIAVGFTTGSIGIISEAAHSGLDLVAAGVTLWAVRAASVPADREHPYGHGKIEHFSALFETGLLLATCMWIVYESLKRLLFEESHVEVTLWAFLVMFVSIAVDLSRSRALMRVARKYRSQALEADALHFSIDVWSSAVVIAGLAAVWLSNRTGLAWLGKADAVAALGVAGIAALVSLRLGRKAVSDLLDAAPAGLLEQVAHAARINGTLSVTQVRVRQSGAQAFADIHISIARNASFERAHAITHAVEDAVRAAVPGIDLVVHADPVEPGHQIGA